ncbi:hypothetical protein [Tepidibacter sp. Z1-5]|uniref:hypothetical protein n=1 Tax=Tepidibacter sp. Z1-5 TaxID=3134138 RepID=UPI0030C2E78E
MLKDILWPISIMLIIVSVIALIVYNSINTLKKCKEIIKKFKILIQRIKENQENNKQLKKQKITCRGLLIKCKDYFSENTNKKLLQIIFISILMTTLKGEYLLKIFPESIHIVYLSLVLFSIVYFLLTVIKSLLVGVKGFERIYNLFVVIVLFLILGMTIVGNLLQDIVESEINFIVILVFIGMMLPCAISFVKHFLEYSNKNLIDIIVGVISFYVFELYIALLFGIYNLSADPKLQNYIDPNSSWKFIIRTIHFGYMYITSPPEFSYRLSYFIQFILGNIIHVVLLGLIISYASSFANNDESKKNINNKKEILEEVAVTKEINLNKKLEKRIINLLC